MPLLVVAALFVASSLSDVAAAEPIFVAINYNIFPLETSTMGLVLNAEAYIPASTFTSISQMYYSHYKEENVFTLSNRDYTLQFDLNQGFAYDLTNKYNAKCVQRNGVMYLPAEFTSRYFGYHFDPIESKYGLIYRIRTVATDDTITFLSASDERLNTLFEAYKKANRPSFTPVPSYKPGVSVTPSPTPSPTRAPMKFAYITIDDGPTAYTDAFLDAFDDYGIKGTFFLVGENLTKNENAVRRMVGDGHAVGLHSYSHRKELFYASPEAMMEELDMTNNLLYQIASYKSRLIRLPFGSGGNSDFTAEMQLALREGGYRFWDWNVDPGDTTKGKTRAQIISDCKKQLVTEVVGNNAYILLHDKKDTLEALPEILDYLVQEDYAFRVITDTEFPFNRRGDIGQ